MVLFLYKWRCCCYCSGNHSIYCTSGSSINKRQLMLPRMYEYVVARNQQMTQEKNDQNISLIWGLKCVLTWKLMVRPRRSQTVMSLNINQTHYTTHSGRKSICSRNLENTTDYSSAVKMQIFENGHSVTKVESVSKENPMSVVVRFS